MQNIETNEITQKLNKLEKNVRNKSKFDMNPKLVAILLIANLVIGIFSLAGIGYLSFKDINRNQMIRTNFPNGGNFNAPNGDMFNQQNQGQPSNN
ncbi:hypothetical protein V7101_20825 [Bacillus velezensis]|uniref:hypothetical protein n=1 Tax=Bacillus velezensis TaxID=492670 RepID=UPI002FFEA4B4